MFTYAIGASGTPYVKIGQSVSPERRLITLQCASHVELILWGTLPGPERRWHRLLDAQRYRGEWFDLSGDTGAMIAWLACRRPVVGGRHSRELRYARARVAQALRLGGLGAGLDAWRAEAEFYPCGAVG